MSRPLLVALALALGLTASSCYFTRSPSRPIPALAFGNPRVADARCLVVFFPGFLDSPESYNDHGFARELVRSGAPCDAVGVDLHYRYYGEPGVADMVYEDVLQPAIARGYDEIWVVGISMGGLGALLTASQYTRYIDGVVLIAPFLGEPRVVQEIEAAGGARSWQPPEGLDAEAWSEANYTQKIWSWLRGYHTDPDVRPPLYLGWGTEDRLGQSDQLLGALLADGHVVSEPGGHEWRTWFPIWRQILAAAPIGRAGPPR